MKKFIKNPFLAWSLKILLAVSLALIILGFTFLQGMFYANKKATVRIANDNCFFSLHALECFDDNSKAKKLRSLFERELDASSIKLAEMCLEHPDYVSRGQYNLLKHVKEYKKKVDPKVYEAISYLESIHDMETWGKFNIEDYIKQKR